MSDYIDKAKYAVGTIDENMNIGLASAKATVAIALALIAIAEELEKINSDEVKNVRDRTWLYRE